MLIEKTFELHQDDWPSIEYQIEVTKAKRIKLDALEAKYERQRQAKAARLKQEAIEKAERTQIRQQAKLAADQASREEVIRKRVNDKELQRRIAFDLAHNVDSLSETINGQPNPAYTPLRQV